MTRSSRIWSNYANLRHDQISSGSDISMTRVIEPSMLELVGANGKHYRRALDAGCGVGHFTHLLTTFSDQVIGIDPSKKSISIARSHYEEANVHFYNTSLEKFVNRNKHKGQFDLVTANMVLMDVDDLFSFVKGVSDLTAAGGTFIASITHPAFWPIYKKYDDTEFDYNKEQRISLPFAISLESKNLIQSFHYHRPIHQYISTILGEGFSLKKIDEPWPAEQEMSLYPQKWDFPRFMIFSFEK